MQLSINKSDPAIAPLLLVKFTEDELQVEIIWGDVTRLKLSQKTSLLSSGVLDDVPSICRYLARMAQRSKLYGSSVIEQIEVDNWMSFGLKLSEKCQSKKTLLEYLDKLGQSLTTVSYLLGSKLTLADLFVWATLYEKSVFQKLDLKTELPDSVYRWYTIVLHDVRVSNVMESIPTSAVKKSQSTEQQQGTARKDEGKFVDLPGASIGNVVVRFPPEASGYLHIGHAKAALLNQYYKDAFQGKLIMRFDDTNPAKEKVDFEKVILEDIKLLEITPDRYTHTSDYFDLMLEYCEKLLKASKAYVDDTDPETMKEQREQCQESVNRNNSVERNMEMWQTMVKGTPAGQKCCVRAKIDMSSTNGCMRDPTIYRCKNEPHPKTGTKYKVYPTYDFACPIVDSIEGVTHCLRTMEYHDRDEQFFWFISALSLRAPHIWEYSRLNMTNTVLSKRKLTWFVDSGLVDGWDDPRLPTVRGVLRHGMTVEGLKQFIIAQGSSRSVVVMEWDKIWAFNRKVIDPVAPRYTAVDGEPGSFTQVNVQGVSETSMTVAKHPKNPDVGTKVVWTSPNIMIDSSDAEQLKEGENTTFINWGNLTIKKINRNSKGIIESVEALPNLEDKDFKKTMKITWLADCKNSAVKNVPCIAIYYDHIISKPVLSKDEDFKSYIGHSTKKVVKMIGDPELVNVKKSEIIQLQRKGFFVCDSPYKPASNHTGVESPIVLIFVPDGHTKEMPTQKVALKQSVGSTVKKEQNKKIKEASPDLSIPPPVAEELENSADLLCSLIQQQGDKVRSLKANKAPKDEITAEVQQLLKLKNEYKSKTGEEWKPGVTATPKVVRNETVTSKNSPITQDNNAAAIIDIQNKITQQGDVVRVLKADKAEKSKIDAEVKALLQLKAEYKNLSGQDWKPQANQPKQSQPVKEKVGGSVATEILESKTKLQESNVNQAAVDALNARIIEVGDKIRKLKAEKADKNIINAEVSELLKLKLEYKNMTGQEWKGATPVNARNSGKGEKESKPNKEKKAQAPKPTAEKKNKESQAQSNVKKQTRLCLEARKEDNLADWYSQVITKGELIEYYDVSGCYILRPWSFAIWDVIREYLDKEIKKLGVQNCYFPIFVSRHVLEKEKTHIADFAPEVAWVTKSGDSDLAEPIAIRPTSETVMYPAYAKWLQSYRDLPIKLNQWNNVVRWEFKHPQPFIRTREFLWQEGHTAFATAEEAQEEVFKILDLYASIYSDLLAIPVVKGRKTEKEKFAGGNFTTTVEAFISASGRAIQGATSHFLGQNFSKMFEIVFADPDTKEKKYVYQNSWGITTRTIGVMIMVHADNQGLVLPPRVAAHQVVIVPCGVTVSLSEQDKDRLTNACKQVEQSLRSAGVRVHGDYRDNYSPGWKFNHWELKGVPIRLEIGPKDIASESVMLIRRDTGGKVAAESKNVIEAVQTLLENIHDSLLQRATDDLKSHTILTSDWSEFLNGLDKKCIILSPFCGDIPCEEKIKQDSTRATDDNADPGAPSMGAKSLCTPFEQPKQLSPNEKCIHPDCKKKPAAYTLFGRSY